MSADAPARLPVHLDCMPGFCVLPAGDPNAEAHGAEWVRPLASRLCREEDCGWCDGLADGRFAAQARACECSCHHGP